MVWMKHFHNDRKPFFLYILTTHLISENSDDKQRKDLAKALAYKYISKAAADSRAPINQMSDTSKEIQSMDDLNLLLKIYRAQHKYNEAIAICEDPRFGLQVHTGSNKWDVFMHSVELLAIVGRWDDVYWYCRWALHESLSGVQDEPATSNSADRLNLGIFGNNWKVWQMLLRASNNDLDPVE